MSGERFGGYPAEFGYATGETTLSMNLKHLEAWELTPNNMVGVQHPPGSIDPAAFLMSRTKPSYRMRSPDLATIFGTVGFMSGKCFDRDSNFYLQERADCGTFLTGATHIGRRVHKGFMYLDSISAELESQDGAMANMIFHPLWNEVDACVQHISATALPITTPGFVSSYFLGPIFKSGVQIPGVMSQTWTPQIRFQSTPHSPHHADTHGSIIQRDATFTVRCLKLDEFDSYAETGTNISDVWDFYLQQADATNANADGRIAAANAVHAKVSFQSGRMEIRNTSYDGVEDAGMEIVFTPSGAVTFSLTGVIPLAYTATI